MGNGLGYVSQCFPLLSTPYSLFLMTLEEREMLERTLALAEENHRLLKKMDRANRWARIAGVARLVVILTPFVVGYFYLQPYLMKIGELYDSAINLRTAPERSIDGFLNFFR